MDRISEGVISLLLFNSPCIQLIGAFKPPNAITTFLRPIPQFYGSYKGHFSDKNEADMKHIYPTMSCFIPSMHQIATWINVHGCMAQSKFDHTAL